MESFPLLTTLGAGVGQDEVLGNQESDEKHGGEHADAKDLGVEDEEAAPGSLAERGPGISDRDVAGAAEDSGLDTALEGAVEGNNGLLVIREEGGLDSHKRDVGGDHDKDAENNGDDVHHDILPALRSGGDVPVARLLLLEAEDPDEEERDAGGCLGEGPEQEDRAPGGLEGVREGGRRRQKGKGEGGVKTM